MKKVKLLSILAPVILVGGGISLTLATLTSCAKEWDAEFTSPDQVFTYLKNNIQDSNTAYNFAGAGAPPTQTDYYFAKNQLNIQVIGNGLLYYSTIQWAEENTKEIKIKVVGGDTAKAEVRTTSDNVSTLDVSYIGYNIVSTGTVIDNYKINYNFAESFNEDTHNIMGTTINNVKLIALSNGDDPGQYLPISIYDWLSPKEVIFPTRG